MVRFLVLLALTSICVGFTGVGKRLSSSNVQSNENLKKEVKSEHSVHKERVKCRMALSSGTGDSMNTENPYYVGMSAYEILGVKKGADKKVVKAAYRKLVSVWHPDKFPDNEDKKKEGGLRWRGSTGLTFVLKMTIEEEGMIYMERRLQHLSFFRGEDEKQRRRLLWRW